MTTTNEWEQSFKDRFSQPGDGEEVTYCGTGPIVDFIRTEIEKAEQRGRDSGYLEALSIVEAQHGLFPDADATAIAHKLRRLHHSVKAARNPQT